MSYLTWTESFAIGIEDVDTDHKTLFDLVDQFHEAYARGEGNGALESVFEALLDYTENHFRREELLMERVGFPGLAEHRAAHVKLKADVLALHDRYRRGELQGEESDLCLEILAFLNNWLHFHIKEEDMRIRDFIKVS